MLGPVVGLLLVARAAGTGTLVFKHCTATDTGTELFTYTASGGISSVDVGTGTDGSDPVRKAHCQLGVTRA